MAQAGDSGDALWQRAHRGLYAAKAAGRGCDVFVEHAGGTRRQGGGARGLRAWLKLACLVWPCALDALPGKGAGTDHDAGDALPPPLVTHATVDAPTTGEQGFGNTVEARVGASWPPVTAP